VRAIEVHPGNPKLVHHANVIVDRTRSFRRRDGEDGEAGFPGMEVETESGGNGFDPDSHFLFWKPGTAAQPEPEDMAWTLYPNSDLVVNLHLQPSGKPETIQPEIGLYFTDRAPARRPILVQLEHDGAIDIAPGAGNFAVTDEWKLPVEARVLAIYPHAHYIGKRVECWAILPSGKRVELIRIEAWDINWQAVYAYRKPVDLPANTRVMMRITYDNRGSTKRVKAGNRSEDEMGHVWLQLLPVHDGKDDVDPRLTIQISVMRRRLEKYPADFMAHYNLGAALQSLGQSAESLPYLEKAARLKPANVAARNTLGVAYMIADRLDRAIPEFQEVLKLQPAYTQARFNLALALAAQNDADGAIREFEVFLGTEPDDAKAQSEMAKALVKTGRVREAIPHFQKAAELLRNDAGAWTNLGAALAMTRDYAAAIAAFETALKIEPDHPQARANLARAKADKGKL
jgi:tetratricopeptide (TPR) repeat protein